MIREFVERMDRDELIEHVYELEAKIEALNPNKTEEAAINLAKAFRLTGKEADMLLALSDGRAHSKDNLLTLVYGGRDEPMVKIVDVFICKLRKKLAGSGIEIGTLWGRGYVIENREPLLAVMRGEPPVRGAETGGAPIGRQLNGESRPHGYVRDLALSFIRDRLDGAKACFTTKEIERAVEHRCGGSSMVRNLEKGKHLRVLKAPLRRPNSAATNEWVVEMAA